MRTRLAGVATVALVSAGISSAAQASVSFAFTPGPGLTSLFMTDPPKAMGIMSSAAKAAANWSTRVGDSVTLKYTLDYDPALPALGAAFDVYAPVPYGSVKGALFGKATSTFDFSAASSLQPGSSLTLWTNDLSSAPYSPVIDADGSINNMLMDVSRAHKKGLGLLPATDGGPGADGTIKVGPGIFDFDPDDGITSGTFDLTGVLMHEIGHSMGFVSGVDTMTTLLPPTPFVPGGPRDATSMVTVLDLFRYSTDSLAAGLFVPDLSLPVPGGFSTTRYFSIDGGLSPLELFSTGVGLLGDSKQAGHWKDDPMFGLMDPELSAGFALTSATTLLFNGMAPAPDLIALDVIGWHIIPAPGSVCLLGIGIGALARRRRMA